MIGKEPKIIRDKLQDKIINDNWTLFETRKRRGRKNKKYNRIDRIGRINKDRIIRDIRTLFDTKKEKEGGKKRNKTKK